jgi:hypothetical protein
MLNYLLLFGNNVITNEHYGIGDEDSRGANPIDLQELPIARGGSVVVNERPQSKQISLQGSVGYDSSKDNIVSLTDRLNRLYQNDGPKYLRIVPDLAYQFIDDAKNTTGVTLSDDATGLASDTDEFQFFKTSTKFNVVVATSVNNYATYTRTVAAVNLSSLALTGNIEFALNIPDTLYVTSVEVRVGSSSGNYYSATLTKNYEAKPIDYGWNYFSTPWSGMTITGSPNTASMTYVFVRINYSASAVDISNCNFGGLLWVNESKVKNYQCRRRNQVQVSRLHSFQVNHLRYSVNLLNETGYGEATHPIQLFNQTGITTLSNTQTFTLNGSRDQYPTYSLKLNTITNLNQLRITNLNNNQSVIFSNTWAPGDIVTVDTQTLNITKNGHVQIWDGFLPIFKPGFNRLKVDVVQSSNNVLAYTAYDSETYTDGSAVFAPIRLAQSFIAPISGSIVDIKITIRGASPGAAVQTLALQADSAGSPSGTNLTSGTFISILDYQVDSPTLTGFTPYTVTAGTTYWIVLLPDASNGTSWKRNSTGPYASGSAKSYSGGSWSAVTGDFTFSVTTEPTPATNIDFSASYKPLFS